MTAGLYGHSNPIIRDAIIRTVSEAGLNLGATTVAESQFAEQIRQRFPSIEQLRFCNSGTEANLYALSIARRATGLSKVIVFNGGYHGGILSFAHGVAENNVDRGDWIVGKYNDVEGVQTLISKYKGFAAAVLVEGMQGAGGCIPGTAEFLHAIQAATRENEMIFILDEVMTSRLAPGGLQSRVLSPCDSTPLKPDITTLGKWIAGGMTIGVFGGRRDLLSLYDPRAVMDASGKRIQMSHSGTFNNNTLAMNVGLVALSTVYTAEACTALNNLGDWFRQGLQARCRGTRMSVTGIGAVCNVHFTPDVKTTGVTHVGDLEVETNGGEAMLKDLFWYYAVRNGYWISRRGMLSLILGITRAELQGFLDMVEDFVKEHHAFFRC
jgi:glutamate-1-semialdehyde 2,1-aminomutase